MFGYTSDLCNSLFPLFQINVYVTDKSTLDEAEFAALLAEFQSAQVTTAETSLTNLAILLMALFALLLILMVIITASVFLRLEPRLVPNLFKFNHRLQTPEPAKRSLPLPRSHLALRTARLASSQVAHDGAAAAPQPSLGHCLGLA